MSTEQNLLGLSSSHIEQNRFEAPVHRELMTPLNTLKDAAQKAGFDLFVVSGFRDFYRQRDIWNAKAKGQRPVLGADGRVLDISLLNETERMFAILRWSALPGASRHHWGTDIDIIDGNAVPEGYRVQLTRDETRDSGVFAKFHRWLDEYLALKNSDFFRPYTKESGGVAPEPWHLSYRPLANTFAAQLTPETILDALAAQKIELFDSISRHFDEIYTRFIAVDELVSQSGH